MSCNRKTNHLPLRAQIDICKLYGISTGTGYLSVTSHVRHGFVLYSTDLSPTQSPSEAEHSPYLIIPLMKSFSLVYVPGWVLHRVKFSIASFEEKNLIQNLCWLFYFENWLDSLCCSWVWLIPACAAWGSTTPQIPSGATWWNPNHWSLRTFRLIW